MRIALALEPPTVVAYDGGILLASNGGAVAVPQTGTGEPIFHAVPNGRDPVRLVRVGAMNAAGAPENPTKDVGIVALSGPNVWLWKNGTFAALDMRDL